MNLKKKPSFPKPQGKELQKWHIALSHRPLPRLLQSKAWGQKREHLSQSLVLYGFYKKKKNSDVFLIQRKMVRSLN